jgi:hypothetical protein
MDFSLRYFIILTYIYRDLLFWYLILYSLPYDVKIIKLGKFLVL